MKKLNNRQVKSMNKVIFDAETHTYTLVNEKGKKVNDLVSVTQLLKKHGLSPDYSAVDESVLNAKAERGSVIHEELEKYINDGEIGFTNELTQFIAKANEMLLKPIKSEFIVHNEEIAGTVDVIGTVGANALPFIGDFKTTAVLHKDSIAWQLSLYAYLSGEIYEKYFAIHFPNEDTCKIVEIQPIAESEIVRLLECERNSELFERKTLELTFSESEKIVMIQNELKSLNDRKKQLEEQESEFKEMLIAKMEETGVKSIDNDYFKITYVAPSQRETIDSARLKREHPDLAVEYTKTSLVKASVRITLKD